MAGSKRGNPTKEPELTKEQMDRAFDILDAELPADSESTRSKTLRELKHAPPRQRGARVVKGGNPHKWA